MNDEITKQIENAPTLHDLACKLAKAKKDETMAKSIRIELEEDIASMIKTSENGSKTEDTGEGLKVTVKRKLNYKANVEAIRGLGLPDGVAPLKLVDPVPAHYEFDQKAYEKIVAENPDIAGKLSACVTTKPAKVSVTLKVGQA